MALAIGCGKSDSTAGAGAARDARASVAETKRIAEDGFMHGLPLVNYAVMYAYSVDSNSGQFKAPFKPV